MAQETLQNHKKTSGCTVSKSNFGTIGTETVDLFTLKNTHGMQVSITNFGGIITALEVPDKHGVTANVVAGLSNLSDYINDDACFGAIVGPYANRIGNKGFWLDGRFFSLHNNEGDNTLHSSVAGVHKKLWHATPICTADEASVRLATTSQDKEGGFPGNLEITATYTLNKHNELRLLLEATTDQATPVSLTGHSYFNLAGRGTAMSHTLMLKADHFLPVDTALIPEQTPAHVADSPFDFRQPRAIGGQIEAAHPQLKLGNGYDHTFVIPDVYRNGSMPIATVTEPYSGRVLELFTTSPGVQFYSANYLSGCGPNRQGEYYQDREAFALEPQQFPDAPNQPAFPNPVLRPGEKYENQIVYKFSTL